MPETMEMPVIGNRLEEIFRAIVDHAGAKIVFGEPVTTEGKTILPVARLGYGFGGGSGRKRDGAQHGGGGGAGLKAKAVGVVEITASGTRFIRFVSVWDILACVGFGVLLGLLVMPNERRN